MTDAKPSPDGVERAAAALAKARDEILDATLKHVPFDGWTMEALHHGAHDAGYDDVTAMRAFPDGGRGLLAAHSARADERMVAALAAADPAAMRVRERIAFAVRTRLEQSAGEREAVRRALTVLALPQNAALAARLLYRTVDAIWYAAGDTATDFNFYTKRGLLAGVYAATLLYWINDDSHGFARTWAFLDRRIADVMKVPKATARAGKVRALLPNPFRIVRTLFRAR